MTSIITSLIDRKAYDDVTLIVDELTYQCYAHNRLRSPHVPVDAWRRIFGERIAAFEQRFEKEQRWTSSA